MVVGTPRSGTTLVQRYVTEECGLRSGPETQFFTTVPSILRKRRRRIDDSLALREALVEYSRIPQLESSELDVDRVMAFVAPKAVHLYAVFEEVVSQLSGNGNELAEKTPGHLWWWNRLTHHDPSLKFVIVVRDPRAVVASLRAAPFTNLDLSLLAQWWKSDQAMTRAAVQKLGPSRCLIVHYEDAVAREEVVRKQLSELHPRLRRPQPAQPEAAQRLALPWETWKSGFDKPPSQERINAWRSILTREETEAIERLCRREMADLGYEPAQRSKWADRFTPASRPLARSRYRMAVVGHRWRQRQVSL